MIELLLTSTVILIMTFKIAIGGVNDGRPDVQAMIKKIRDKVDKVLADAAQQEKTPYSDIMIESKLEAYTWKHVIGRVMVT